MKKFKVGDRVRLVDSSMEYMRPEAITDLKKYCTDNTFTIRKIISGNRYRTVEFRNGITTDWRFHGKDLKMGKPLVPAIPIDSRFEILDL